MNIVVLSCGGMSSQNCTYLEQASFTSITTNPCQYRLRRNDDDVCRIRLDFNMFTLAGPTTGTVAAAAATEGGTILNFVSSQKCFLKIYFN